MSEATPAPSRVRFPDRAALRAILRYRPIFRRSPEELLPLGSSTPSPDGEAPAPAYTYAQDFLAFVNDLHSLGFIAAFDWPDWQDRAERLQHDPETLRDADLTDLVKLLTVHIQKERFCEGHWAVGIEEGRFRDILDRLASIDAEIDRSSVALRLIENRENLEAHH